MRTIIATVLCVAMVATVTAAEPQRPRITAVAHIALYVHDIAKTRAFYKEFLGYEEPFHLDNPDGSLHITWIKVNDGQYIELFPEKSADAGRLYHISVEVDNAEAMLAYLGAQGIKVKDKVSKGRIGNSNFFVNDPDGHAVEIVQYEPDSWTTREHGKFMAGQRISTHIRHLGISVGSLEPAMKFYCGLLGFRETWRGSKDGKTLSWVNLQVPEGDDYLELMLYDPATPPTKGQLGGMNHICLEVADVAAAEKTLKSRPLPSDCKAMTAMKAGVNGKRQINCFDPDGTRVEIMELNTFDGKPVPSSQALPPKPLPKDGSENAQKKAAASKT
jgi:catechol 2,3-dioxygenase-like lactoylglutathione lyase family enzyme